jgi:aryl-alcohol dehydrogenase-like predicted oxidoreductase
VSIAAIHAALDDGINWIDTAAVHGLGHSEEVVVQAFHGRSNGSYVFTKCERVWDDQGGRRFSRACACVSTAALPGKSR